MGGAIVKRLVIVAIGLALVVGGIVGGPFATQNFAVAQGQRYYDEIFTSSTVTTDIAYGQTLDHDGNPVTLYLDLYQPTGDTELSRPAYVWVHGGAFIMGDKGDSTDVMVADRFAKRGYVTVSINYRLRPGHYMPWGSQALIDAWYDAQHDAQAAVRWLRANADTYGIDAGRIAIGGYSAGAMTSVNVGYNSSDPGDSGNPGYPSTVSSIVDVSGAVADTALMEAGEPPVLIVHGSADTIVPYFHATDIVTRAQAVGIPFELHTLEGVSHFVWDTYTEQIIGWMSDFLFTYLAPQQPTPTPTPAAVGGIAEFPDLASKGGSGVGGAYAVLGAVGAVLAITVAGTVSAKKRGGR